MFRKDYLTLERKTCSRENGEAVWGDNAVIAENIPCHLSVSLNNTIKSQNYPYLVSDYTLFLDYTNEFEIKENDILNVTTAKNQKYKLYAGEIKHYNLTTQIRCKQEKIIES